MKCSCLSHNGFLTSAGFAEVVQQTSLEGLRPLGDSVIVDIPGSVSGLRRDEDLFVDVSDKLLSEQYARFHNGS